eukprot:6782993-Pyramimonas_sp.AAC.1
MAEYGGKGSAFDHIPNPFEHKPDAPIMRFLSGLVASQPLELLLSPSLFMRNTFLVYALTKPIFSFCRALLKPFPRELAFVVFLLQRSGQLNSLTGGHCTLASV